MRNWSRFDDDGSIHPIGNGKMLVYEQGPNINQVIGPPYSAPSFARIAVEEEGSGFRAESEREAGTAIWRHAFFDGQRPVASAVDYMLPDRPVFIRDTHADSDMAFRLSTADNFRMDVISGYFNIAGAEKSTTAVLTIPKGSTFFTHDSVIEERNLLLTCTGCIQMERSGGNEAVIRVGKGSGRIILCSGNFAEAVVLTEGILSGGSNDYIAEVREFWQGFTSRRKNFGGLIASDHPLRGKMLDAIDSVSVLIKCQQSCDGGVAAGHFYPLAYVRDQAGVFRGLLALGYTEEARAILDFWLHKWSLFGNLFNAEGMGNDHARLFFTNDEVEIPAYVILCCMIYHDAVGDNLLFEKQLPMLKWALDVQMAHLVQGMTEFSGDETYIAGGTFSKYLIFHGSAESTLLFVTGAERLISWVGEHKLWQESLLSHYRDRVDEAKGLYRTNFIADGVLYANNPERDIWEDRPRFMYTYCYIHEAVDKKGFFSWLELTPEGFYACPTCRGRKMPDNIVDWTRREVLSSVSLVPVYINSSLLTDAETLAITAPVFALFEQRGMLPSNLEGTRSLGYDYGLLLYNMVKQKNPMMEKALAKMLNIIDKTGAWVEYYDNDVPSNCRARPWESAINIEAIIEYINVKAEGILQ